MSSSKVSMLFFLCSITISLVAVVASAGNFYQDYEVMFGDQHAKVLENGQIITLALDKSSGAGFKSKNAYLFGKFDMQIKLQPGNSAGTVTTFYLSSSGANHDEIDFEFLGNSTGEPYTIHTNVYAQGQGLKEQQFHLWFDPTQDFHTYSIVWNTKRIIFLVDDSPIRVFNNLESIGLPFPKNQSMGIYATFWNADDWATQGGRVKTDWSLAPFTASYRNFNINACPGSQGPSCASTSTERSAVGSSWKNQGLNAAERNRLRWVQSKFMVYDYCTDRIKFNKDLPRECKHSRI
ncbi:hypothetical protein ACFX13_046854 [Malus domestica]|uniref:Xyloglucan endotransglucosylase/hydrolase n=1 Tax=Malus domestica TaxID=3750 RepID=A0A498J3I6_MALDO|nr:hypothetical protein DVH24_032686 [Malus domestica]